MFDGSKIKKLRLAKGISRKDFSLMTKVPLRTLEEWESGSSDINKVSYLVKISEILDCSVLDLCRDEVIDNDKKIRNNRLDTVTMLTQKQLKMLEDILNNYLLNNNKDNKDVSDLLKLIVDSINKSKMVTKDNNDKSL